MSAHKDTSADAMLKLLRLMANAPHERAKQQDKVSSDAATAILGAIVGGMIEVCRLTLSKLGEFVYY